MFTPIVCPYLPPHGSQLVVHLTCSYYILWVAANARFTFIWEIKVDDMGFMTDVVVQNPKHDAAERLLSHNQMSQQRICEKTQKGISLTKTQWLPYPCVAPFTSLLKVTRVYLDRKLYAALKMGCNGRQGCSCVCNATKSQQQVFVWEDQLCVGPFKLYCDRSTTRLSYMSCTNTSSHHIMNFDLSCWCLQYGMKGELTLHNMSKFKGHFKM